MNPKDTPVKIGIEVEAEWPTEKIHNSWGDEFDTVSESHFKGTHPAGWVRGTDGEMEFRFKGPADTLAAVFERCDSLEEYMKKWKIKGFDDQGTHIHLGVKEWLQKRYPKQFPKGSANDWRNAAPTSFAWAYIAPRTNAIWSLVPEWRHESGWCEPYEPNYDPHKLVDIHNSFVDSSWHFNNACGALEHTRRGLPTFECRMFAGTNVLGAVKGYAALLVALIKGAEKVLDKVDWSALEELPEDTPNDKVPLQELWVNPWEYGTRELCAEIRKTGFLVDPLLDWMERTRRSSSKLVEFNADLSEIYGNSYQISTPLAAAA